ncbi:hypothetical protein Tco_1428473 [Tanacetum coccineum]
MRSDELYKFRDGTLTRLLTSLEDITKNIHMEYLPKRKWSSLEKKRAHIMIKAINKLQKERRMMRSLEKFVGGRHYRTDLRLLQRMIRLLHIVFVSISQNRRDLPRDIPLDSVEVLRSILMDLKVTPTKHGRMTKPYSSPRFIANCFIEDSHKNGHGSTWF